MTDLPPIFIPGLPPMSAVPTVHDQIQDATNKITKTLTESMANFDQDVVIAIAIIVNALCHNGTLQREPLLQGFRSMHEQRKLGWTGAYSPLSFLADLLQGMGEAPPETAGKQDMARVLRMIDGGLSKKPETEPAD